MYMGHYIAIEEQTGLYTFTCIPVSTSASPSTPELMKTNMPSLTTEIGRSNTLNPVYFFALTRQSGLHDS